MSEAQEIPVALRVIETHAPRRSWLRAPAPLVVLASITLGALLLVHFGLRFMLTPSLPRGIYRTVNGPLVRGAIVVTCLPDSVARFALQRGYLWRGDCPGGVVPLGKLVLAISGDTISLSGDGLRLNGRAIRNTRPRKEDSQRRPLTHYPYGTHVVRPGEIWLFSPYHPLSFDSRYFGPVPSGRVLSRLAPVWTVSER